MNKMFAVLKREYLAAVRKKMFIVMTILFPVLMATAILLPSVMMARGMGEKRVAVLDGTGRLADSFAPVLPPAAPQNQNLGEALRGRRRAPDLPQTLKIEYVNASKGSDLKSFLTRLNTKDSQKLDSVFVIPADAIEGEKAKMTYYSRNATDVITQERLNSVANRAIQRLRLDAHGLNPDQVDRLMRQVPVEGVQLSRSGEQKKGGELNLILAFIFAALLLIPSFIYGVEIMRGIIQEKNDRVVEILVSSMSPRQLLTGKVVGIAFVGLTQIAAWLVMATVIAVYGSAIAASAGFNVMQFLRPALFVYFLIFFVLAYLTYVCIYAIAGAICNSDKEAQQLIAPISMFMMIPWFIMFPIITNPDSPLAVGFSLAPVFGPLTMFVRTIVSEPPMLHIVASMLVSVATIFVFFWATAKIFRVGIFSYGKRPTLAELWQWLKVA